MDMVYNVIYPPIDYFTQNDKSNHNIVVIDMVDINKALQLFFYNV